MCGDTFKRGLAFSLTLIISANFLLLLNGFVTKALKYKAIVKFKNNLYALLRIL